MSHVCRAFERLQDRAGSTDREGHSAWAAHLRICTSCQEQDVADRALLAALSGVRQPELPTFVAHCCARRIRSAPAAEPLNRRARTVLRAYWLLTLVGGSPWSRGRTGRRPFPLQWPWRRRLWTVAHCRVNTVVTPVTGACPLGLPVRSTAEHGCQFAPGDFDAPQGFSVSSGGSEADRHAPAVP
jgi:hypothetical protein